VITARDVNPDGVSPNPRVQVSNATAQRLQRYQLRPGDIILVRVGVTTRYTTVTDQHDGWLLGGSCFGLRVLKGTSPDYLAYYLAHPTVQDWLTEHTQRGVMPTLSKRTISELPVVLPPIALQQDILHTAEIIDTKIRAHQDVIKATLALRELLLPRLLAGDPGPLRLQSTSSAPGRPRI
jgi:restriction endonuclease S subunit